MTKRYSIYTNDKNEEHIFLLIGSNNIKHEFEIKYKPKYLF